jgi:hypothetical protein
VSWITAVGGWGSRLAGEKPTHDMAMLQKEEGSISFMGNGDYTMQALVAPAVHIGPSTFLCPHWCACVTRLCPCDHVTVENYQRAVRDADSVGLDICGSVESPATER